MASQQTREESIMSKNIIFCADGTWNGPGEPDSNYQPGDKIFLIGFSRGAYTARALAGMITAKGLLDAKRLDLADKNNAYRLGVAVWFDYRKAALQGDPGRLSNLVGAVFDFPVFL